MKILTATKGPDVAAGLDYPDHAGWDLADDARISYGQDGDGGDWVVYLGLGPGRDIGLGGGEDLYVKVSREQIVEHARHILYVCGEPTWPPSA